MEGGGESRFSSLPPSLPLLSTLQTWYLCNVCWRRENTSCTCPRLDVCLDCTKHMTLIVPHSLSPFLMLSPTQHHPEPPHRSSHTTRATCLPQALIRSVSGYRTTGTTVESHRSFVSSLLGALAHLGEDGHKTRTHTLAKPIPNLDQYQRELITGSCIFR